MKAVKLLRESKKETVYYNFFFDSRINVTAIVKRDFLC